MSNSFTTSEPTANVDAGQQSHLESVIAPRLDWFTAKHMIQQVLAMVTDEELEVDEVEIRTGEDGVKFVVPDPFGGGTGYGIGCSTSRDADGERPVIADYRGDAADQALYLEIAHRVELAHWEALRKDGDRRHGLHILDDVADELLPENPVTDLVTDVIAGAIAEDVLGGRVIHNVETDTITDAKHATDEHRSDAVAAYKRMVLRGLAPTGPALASADDVITGRARYADTEGGHADRRTLAEERLDDPPTA